jgi:hypothetical protein
MYAGHLIHVRYIALLAEYTCSNSTSFSVRSQIACLVSMSLPSFASMASTTTPFGYTTAFTISSISSARLTRCSKCTSTISRPWMSNSRQTCRVNVINGTLELKLLQLESRSLVFRMASFLINKF